MWNRCPVVVIENVLGAIEPANNFVLAHTPGGDLNNYLIFD